MNLLKRNMPELLRILILITTVLVIYANSVDAPFQIDDQVHIVLNQHINHPEYYFNSDNLLRFTNGRMIAFLTYVLNYKLGGFELEGYHFFNIIMHVLVVLLVYKLAVKIIRLAPFNNNYSGLFPFFTALIFAVHPVHTEAVTYITQRMVTLSALFYLSAVLCYIKAREVHLEKKWILAVLYYFAVGALFIFAMWSKENALTLPMALLLIEFYFIRNDKGNIRIKFFTGLLFLFIAVFIYKLSSGIPRFDEAPPLSVYWKTEFGVVLKYLVLSFVPVNQQFFYHIEPVDSLMEVKTIISSILIVLILLTAIFIYKRNKIISFGIFWYFIALSAEAFIPLKYFMNEYRLYLSIFGFSVIIAGTLSLVQNRKHYQTVSLLLVCYVIFLSVSTYYRNELWKDPVVFWNDNLTKAPDNPEVNLNVGYYYLRAGMNRQSIPYFNKAISLKKNYKDAFLYKGAACSEIGLYQEAISTLEIVLSLDPDSYLGHYNKGATLYKLKQYDEAVCEFKKTLRINGKNPAVFFSLGDTYYQQYKLDSAIICYSRCIKLKPDHYNAYYHRALSYFYKKNKYNEALRDFEICRGKLSNMHEILNYMAISFRETGNYKQALDYHNSSLNYKPDFLFGLISRARTLESGGKPELALYDIETILKYDPHNSEVLRMKRQIEKKLSN